MVLAQRIRWSESAKYGFVIGRVRSLEVFLLDRSVYERLIRAEGVNEFLNILLTTRYGEYIREIEGEKWEEVFRLAEADNFNFTLKYAADPWFAELLKLQREVFEFKFSLKNRLKGRASESASQEKVNEGLKKEMRDLGDRLLNMAREKEDPGLIDIGLDRFLHRATLTLTKGRDYAHGYYRLLGDVTNITTFFRLKILGEGEEVFQEAFLPGGEVSYNTILEIVEKRESEFKRKPYFIPLIQAGLRLLKERQSFLPLERLGRELLLSYLNVARFVALGYEPLFRFYILREEELRNLRQLYGGKVMGLTPQECQELVVYG